jgi:hypothetical protein
MNVRPPPPIIPGPIIIPGPQPELPAPGCAWAAVATKATIEAVPMPATRSRLNMIFVSLNKHPHDPEIAHSHFSLALISRKNARLDPCRLRSAFKALR